MTARATIVDGPLAPQRPDAPGDARAGAVLVFEGTVRADEHGTPIAALHYQTYDPMAAQELQRLAHDVAARHALVSLDAVHSRGRVAVGEVSLRVTIRSAHRAEALDAMAEFIDRLKRDVPIWKSPAL